MPNNLDQAQKTIDLGVQCCLLKTPVFCVSWLQAGHHDLVPSSRMPCFISKNTYLLFTVVFRT